MHVNKGGQSQVLLEKNVFNKGGYLLVTPPKCSIFVIDTFCTLLYKRSPPNCSIFVIDTFCTLLYRSPPKCTIFVIDTFCTLLYKRSPPNFSIFIIDTFCTLLVGFALALVACLNSKQKFQSPISKTFDWTLKFSL